MPGVIKQPSCFCLCNDRQPLEANNHPSRRRLRLATPGSTLRYLRRRRLLTRWPLAPGTDPSFKAVSLLPFVLAVDAPGRYYLGAEIRTSRAAPSPGSRLNSINRTHLPCQLTFHGPLLAHHLMQYFSRHVSACVPMHNISVPVQHPGRQTDADQSKPLPSISLRSAWQSTHAWALKPQRADGGGNTLFSSRTLNMLMHCYPARLVLQNSGPLARYPAAAR